MPASPVFRFAASTIFLTYPQCTLTKEELLQELHQVFDIKEYCICLELHSDGHPHLHAFLKLNAKINRFRPDFADIRGYHPNITSPRSIKAVVKYIEKDGNFIRSDGIDDLLKKKKTYKDVVLASENKENFLANVFDEFPRDAVLHHEKLLAYADWRFKETLPDYRSPYAPEDFPNTPAEMTDWAREQLAMPRPDPMVHRATGIILVGASRLGKTAWARSLGIHMYHAGSFNLENWSTNVSYAVFDDIPWEWFPSKKQLLGSQYEFNLTDKYKKKKAVTYALPWVYSMNEDNWNKILDDPIKTWLLQNSIMVRVDRSLF